MPDEPEETFTVRDRRRFMADDTSDTAPETAPEGAQPQSGPIVIDADAGQANEADDAFGEDAYPTSLPDVYSVLALFLGELRNLAWMRMGLVANPGTGQIERDLAQAKIAIDTVSFLASQLEPVVAPEERLPLKALVSDLQVNFVEQSKRGA